MVGGLARTTRVSFAAGRGGWTDYHAWMIGPAGRAVAGVLVGLSTAVVILALAILPFFTPAWMGFAQERAGASAWTGYPEPELRRVTSAIVADLVVGPPAFDVVAGGEAVLSERERSHMRDVRTVLLGMWALAAVGLVVLVAGWLARRGDPGYWSAIRAGGLGLAGGVVLAGVLGVVAFDVLFQAFHEVFFPPGTWTFDPATERLVQLFPYRFWFETAFAVGAVAVVGGGLVAWLAGRQRRTLERSTARISAAAAEIAR